MSQRAAEGGDQLERIDRYLRDSGMASRGPSVVPLTGDASDRRYFRIHGHPILPHHFLLEKRRRLAALAHPLDGRQNQAHGHGDDGDDYQ